MARDTEIGFSGETISFTVQMNFGMVEGQYDGLNGLVWSAFATEEGSIVACDGSEHLSIVRLTAELVLSSS